MNPFSRLRAEVDAIRSRQQLVLNELREVNDKLDLAVRLAQDRDINSEARWTRHFDEQELDRDHAEIQWEEARQRADDATAARQRLADIRRSPEYAAAFDDADPLVSVRIASYRKTRDLVEVAVASVLRQSHQRLEVIVVNDGPNDETRAALAGLDDPRIRYEELPARSSYPRHPHLRWMVAGSPGMNRGVELASGTWIAPLDDDDEFDEDHIERLLSLARERRAEVGYGAVRRIDEAGTEHRVFSDPPAISRFSFQGAIYLKLLDFMPYDTESWRMREPGDWNLVRRMMDAGVRFASTSEYVSTMHSVPYAGRVDP